MKVRASQNNHSSTWLRLLLGLLLAAPVIGQNEWTPYFSLSTGRTFGASDTPVISLTGSQVPEVQIRVYRIKDPLEFYRKIESPHSFGAGEQQRVDKHSFLGSIRIWKLSLRRRIRLFLRGQFTESVSAHFRPPKEPARPAAGNKENYFAETPVLNRDQLVLSFVQPLSKANWSSLTVPIHVRDKGVYLVEAARAGLRAYTIVIKSNLVLVTKVGREHILGFVADRISGEPIPDATLYVSTRNANPATFTTNSNGLASIKVDSKTGSSSDELRVVAGKNGDVTLNALSLWNFGAAAHSWSGYLYTDRPVYRPADTIHFRGILRQAQSPSGYSVPSGRSFSVQIQDPDGKSIYAKTLTANQSGIIHDEFTADRKAALGNYFIQVAGGEGAMTGNFEIQNYKKPEYEVRVAAARARVLQDENLDLTINARYYFGEPVKNAKIEYSLYRSRYFYPIWLDADEQDANAGSSPNDSNNDDEAGEEVLKAEGRLDDQGLLHVSYRTTVSDKHHDYKYRIEARVIDEARREISGTGWAVATYGTFLVNAEPQRYFYEPSGQATVSLRAVDYDGKPIATPIQLSLSRLNLRGEPRNVISKAAGATASDGNGTATLSLPAVGGSYQVTVSARSGNDRIVQGSTYIWIAGTGENSFYADSSGHSVQIVPDKKKYLPGEIAKVLVITGKPNTPVWITTAARDVRFSQLLRSSGPTTSFEYRVGVDDEPGFFVTAQFIRNGEMYQGEKRVPVPAQHHRLNLQISTDKPQYQPGQTARYSVKVTTPEGKPVSAADLSLGVVDEAIYAIRPDTSPDLFHFFYGNLDNDVNTQDSLSYYFSGEAGNRRMLLAQSTVGRGTLAQIKPEPLVQPKIRKAFPDTSFWAADLTTDASGLAQTKVSFPDSLTTWRATAKGATATNRFGGAIDKTVVRKNFILRLALPRFFVQGDETVISAIVHNYLPRAKHAQISVSLNGLDILSGNIKQEVEVPVRGDARVDWRVKVNAGTEAKITGKALTDEESDALEVSLPIRPQGVSIRQSKGGSIAAGSVVSQQIAFASDAEPGSRSISIRLSSSVAGSIFNALDFLTSFPYGCVEQTMSSFLPNLMVTRAMRTVAGVPSVNQSTLDDQVNAGLDRLYSMQHEDGGWGWWPSDNSHPFMTAYVVTGLAEAKANGIAIQPQSFQKGKSWLHTEITRNTDLEPDMQAYLSYALATAGAPDSALTNRIYAQRSKLSPYGTALLGLALEFMKDPRASSLASGLEQSVQQNDQEAWWIANRDEMLDFDMDVSPEATAYAVKLLTHQRQNSPLLPKAALWLVNHRNEGFWWSSSKQTAMVIYGLLDYLKQTNELNPNFSAAVSINGQPVATQKFVSGSLIAAPEVFLADSKLQPGSNQVSVTTSGSGRLYYSIAGTYYSNAAHLEKQGAVALNVLRDYYRMIPSKEADHVVYDLASLTGPLASGDIIAVRLTVTGSKWKYLLAEDPIPAGTEFIEHDNLYQLRTRPPWWQYSFSRRELHDDHMAIFQTYFPQGQQQYFYLLKVVNPGLFHLSPARVSPMYQPGVDATTESRIVQVKP